VAMYSLLERVSPTVLETRFAIFSEALNEADTALLRQTLNATAKPFTLELRRLDVSAFAGFPQLNSSCAAYYRLFAAQAMDVERFLYVDADTLCDVDVSELQSLDMGNAPAGWVPEAPLARAVDRTVAQQLGNSETEPYFNSGVILVNVAEWRRQRVTEKAMNYIAAHRPVFHDQSALNVILHGSAIQLDERFNCVANMRRNWSLLKQPFGRIGRLVHFVDYPKPWDFLAELMHPQYGLWRSTLDQTAMKDFRSWHAASSRKFHKTSRPWTGYKKAFKDRLLFAAYSRGYLRGVKGVEQ